MVAPAGCGKTHLITEIAKRADGGKPFLVLTHTTAGVASLKKKLHKYNVPNANISVSTIDGWAMSVAKKFPLGCPLHASPTNTQIFYPELRNVVRKFLQGGHIDGIIRSTYARLLVDEYQDTGSEQHNIVVCLSNLLPTTVFGDPMQSIFDFGGPLPSWNEVQSVFPEVLALNTPWRWNNAGQYGLGSWILNARVELELGRSINLQTCPNNVFWHPLSGNERDDLANQTKAQFYLRNRGAATDSILVIGSSVDVHRRHKFAKNSKGVHVVEPVDLKDLIADSKQLDKIFGRELVEYTLEIASKVMTGTEKKKLMTRLDTILKGNQRTEPNAIEIAACAVVSQGCRKSLLELWENLAKKEGTRLYRGPVYSAFKETLRLAASDGQKSIEECASLVRERRRHYGDRRIPQFAVGSTLLLKGLEADHVLILNADEMNKKHLYVALSRGAKSVTVFSRSNIVGA